MSTSLLRRQMSVRILPAALAGVALLASPHTARAQKDDKAKDTVETCTMPFGTIAVNEPHEQSMIWLRSYQLGSPSSLLRTFAQKSNCFVVVERGVGMQNINQERALASSGELQEGQNLGKGQIVAADYMMTPTIQGSDNNAGGAGGAIGGGLLRRAGIPVVGGGVKFKEANTSIVVASTRTSVQVAAAEGKARQRDFALGGIFAVGGLLGGAGAYSSTAEGKVVAASLLDNFNAVVLSLKSNANIRPMTADRLAKLTGGDPEAGANFEKGAMVEVKMNGTKLLTSASATSAAVATLRAGETMMYMGERQGDFLRVTRGSAQGWVEQVLVTQSSAKTASGAGGGASVGGVMNEGDVLTPKIDGVKILRTASDAAAVVATLKRGEDVVFLGEEQGTFVKVQGSGGEGWVKKALMSAKP
jgi:SH3-like domain-containing protein